MNLNISYNWLQEYVKTNLSPEEFAAQLSLSGPSIDHVIKAEPSFTKVVVGEIKELKQHPNADKLQLCQVDIGKETLPIVCGAPNIKVGQKVPVALVGGRVGSFEIKKAKIRGEESQGMLCSMKELELGEDHTGIYILPDYTQVGLPLEKVMPIEDYILDTEITSNRPDAMSIIGVAREAAAILNDKFTYSEPAPNLKVVKDLKLSVDIKEKKLCSRYQGIVMTDIQVEPSPLWMQQRLLSAGLRPINNLVDITNYILLEFGQPMHVFDYDKIKGSEINVRLAKKGEKILALDGKTYELTDSNLVIADKENPVAVAGVMGGELSAATEETKSIVLEAATFDAVSIRKTARLLNLHSDSSDLFEKSLKPQATTPALLRAVELVKELASGQVASKVYDEGSYTDRTQTIHLDLQRVQAVLGVNIKDSEVVNILSQLGFEVKGKDVLTVTVPWWRNKDIEGEHDLIEEIARIYGYYKLPANLPVGSLPVDLTSDLEFKWESKIKIVLTALGLNEICSYSFVSEKQIKHAGLNLRDCVKIANPLSFDYEYMRNSLLPGLLQAVEENQGTSQDINLFELSKIYLANRNDLPDEIMQVAAVRAGKDEQDVFVRMKGDLETLLDKLNIAEAELVQLEKEEACWPAKQALEVKVGSEVVGRIGLINQEVLYLFGIKVVVAAFELNFETLMKLAKPSGSYTPLPKYPSIELDLSLEVSQEVLYQSIQKTVLSIDDLIKSVEFLSVYQGKGVDEHKKALAVRIVYQSEDKTLKAEEAQQVHDRVVAELKKVYNAKVR